MLNKKQKPSLRRFLANPDQRRTDNMINAKLLKCKLNIIYYCFSIANNYFVNLSTKVISNISHYKIVALSSLNNSKTISFVIVICSSFINLPIRVSFINLLFIFN